MQLSYGLLIKPVSGRCNLSCGYCFYRHQRATGPVVPMDDAVLRRMIGDYLADVPVACLAWQGGEPTLAGLDFYRRADELIKTHMREGQPVTRALQTNGTLLDPEWACYLAKNGYLVGISIDGQKLDHDRYRKDSNAQPSFARVMRGLGHLRASGAEYNILAVVTPDSAAHPWKLYQSLKRYGTRFLQFIPLMESPEDAGGSSVTLSPEAYGRFLCECFDYWYADLSSKSPLSVRTFDNAVGLVSGIPSETCVFQRGCPISPVIESDGSVYPCDFFVTPEWLLGNLVQTPLPELVRGPVMAEFRAAASRLPDECARCSLITLCNGGCLAERLFAKNPGKVSYYCESYKAFFEHALPRLTRLARSLFG